MCWRRQQWKNIQMQRAVTWHCIIIAEDQTRMKLVRPNQKHLHPLHLHPQRIHLHPQSTHFHLHMHRNQHKIVLNLAPAWEQLREQLSLFYSFYSGVCACLRYSGAVQVELSGPVVGAGTTTGTPEAGTTTGAPEAAVGAGAAVVSLENAETAFENVETAIGIMELCGMC
eukprot:EC095374.1.p2 GENE.EC095374.1~~EC095374.1.p2  ORF type:complete len:170 (+),score=15.56 EC095374.1:70-579(+)